MVDDIDRLTEEEVCLVFLLVSTRRFSESYFSFCSSGGRAVSRTDPTKVLNNDLEDVFRGWYPQFHAQAA